MQYRGYMIREQEGFFEAVREIDGWDCDWIFMLTSRNLDHCKALIDEREDKR